MAECTLSASITNGCYKGPDQHIEKGRVSSGVAYRPSEDPEQQQPKAPPVDDVVMIPAQNQFRSVEHLVLRETSIALGTIGSTVATKESRLAEIGNQDVSFLVHEDALWPEVGVDKASLVKPDYSYSLYRHSHETEL